MPSRSLFALLSLAVAAAGCYPPPGRVPGDSCDCGGDSDSDATFPGVLSIGTPEGDQAGDVVLTVLATDAGSREVTLLLAYSADGAAEEPATILDAPVTFTSAPEPGAAIDVTWDSLADLGFGSHSVVMTVYDIAGTEFFTAASTGAFDVDNEDVDDPPTVAIDTPVGSLPSGATDGLVSVPFSISDPDDALFSIRVEYWDGKEWMAATGGAGSAPVSDLDGTLTAFVWDTLADLGEFDVEGTSLRITANDGFSDGPPSATDPFDVQNDPKPDAGEILVTEVMLIPQDSARYLELSNVTGHFLDLDGLFLANSLGGSTSLAGAGRVSPHELAVLTDDAPAFEDMGLAYALAYTGVNFSSRYGAIIVSDADGELFHIDYDDKDWPFDAGVSMQLSSDVDDAATAQTFAAWCASTREIPTCTDLGTPGQPNDLCVKGKTFPALTETSNSE
jgi:hypothetical protein